VESGYNARCRPRLTLGRGFVLRLRPALGSALVALAVCSCSGAPGALVPASPAAPAGQTAAGASKASLELEVKIPRGGRSKADYISRSTQSIVVYEGKTKLGAFNTTSKSKHCDIADGATFCSFRMGLIPGYPETLAFSAYDGLRGSGALLSQGQVTKRIRPGLNVVAVTLNGIVTSVALALSNPNPPAGTAVSVPLTVTAMDADGNVIIGAGVYTNPIALASSDATGTVTVSPATVTSSGQSVAVAYNGNSIGSASISASATGVTTATATFAPKPAVVGDFQVITPSARRRPAHASPHSGLSSQPTAIVAGPDGNIYAAISNSVFAIVKMTTSGTIVGSFVAGKAPSTLPSEAITGLAIGADGNLWYVTFSHVGYVSLSNGAGVDYPLSSAPPSICAGAGGERIAAAPDGVWVTLQCSSSSQVMHLALDATTATFYDVSSDMYAPRDITVGSDHNLYIAGQSMNTADAEIAQVTVTPPSTINGSSVLDLTDVPNVDLAGVAMTPDGDLWATTGSCAPSAFIRVHLAATFSASLHDVFRTFGCSKPLFLKALPDGTLWAPDNAYAGATRVTPGVYPADPVQENLLLPTPGGVTGSEWDVALGPDGDLYFSDDSSTATTSGDIAKVAY
jgi:hypothetical protein